MAEVIDRAYVEILPDTDAFQGAFSKSMDREMRTSESVVSRGMSRITKIVTGAALAMTAAATGAAAAITGISLTRGFARLADIEDAEAKLRGLGHTAENVQLIMDNAMDAVRGTIFGFDEMAGVAATIVGAGIEPGRELERTLKAIADAAQIGGESITEMGDIIGQVAVAGRVSMNEINRMQTRGIPILSWLAEQMGVTAEEARAMVSAGEVSFKDFRQAIEENIGGAALEAAETTRGAWDNMLFTFARTGAALLSGIFPTFKEVFNGISAAMAPVEELANQIGPALGAALDAFREGEGIRGAIQAFRESLDPEVFSEATGAIRDMVTNGLNYIKDNAADIVGFILEMRGTIIDAIFGIAEALPDMVPDIISTVVDMITGLVDGIVSALPAVIAAAGMLVTGLVEGLVDALPEILRGATQIVTTLISGIVELIPIIIGAGMRLIQGIIEGIITAMPEIQMALVKIIPQVITAVTTLLPDLALLGVRILANIVEGIGSALPEIINTIQNEVIPTVIDTIRTEGPAMIAAGATMITELMQGWLESVEIITRVIAEDIIPAITTLLTDNPDVTEAGIDIIETLVDAFVDNIEMITEFITDTFIPLMTTVIEENLPLLIDSGILMLEAFIDGLVQTMPAINDAIVTKIIPALFNALLTAIPMMNRAGTQLITSLVSSLWNTWRDKSTSNLNRIKNAITNFFRNAGQWLRDAGRQLIDGLIGGITSKFNDVRNALSNLTSSLPSWKGPAHVDRLILRDAGRQVIEGFQAGIDDQVGSVKRQLQGITADIGSIAVQGSPHAPASSSVTVTLAPGAIVINGHGTDAGRQAAEALIEHLGQAVLVR